MIQDLHTQALEKHLAPRLRVTGGIQSLERFREFIIQQPLEKGTNILMLWRGSETLEVVVKPTGSVNLAQATIRHPPPPNPISPTLVSVLEIPVAGCWRQLSFPLFG